MVKPIMRDVLFLGQKSIPATEEDLQVGREHRNRILRLELEKTTPEIHRLASPDLPA